MSDTSTDPKSSPRAAVAALRRRLTPVARSGLRAAAVGVDMFRRPTPGIAILIYHRVGAGTGGQMDLTPEAFDAQLAWLGATQRVLTLDQALAELAGSSVEPGVVLTFDDGTADWVEHVLPALERRRLPATFYVATDFVDRRRPFPGDGTPISWAGLRELANSRLATIGSHTHTHALMDRLAIPDIGHELDRSIDLLSEMLGARPEHFCYPKALLGSPPAQDAIRERFRSATLAGTRANPAGADPYRLARSPIQATDDLRGFRRKAVGGLSFENDLRDRINRVRYRDAET